MIHLYWKNATDKAVGEKHGLTAGELAEVEPAITRAYSTVMEQSTRGKLGYTELPTHADYRRQVSEMVERFRPGTTDLVILGIGGSALGNIALQSALNPSTYNLMSDRKRGGPRLFVMDNVDPVAFDDVMRLLGRRLKSTVFNVISKSGRTAETAAQFMIVRKLLEKRLGNDYAGRIVATTDPECGTLCEIADAEGYARLPVPQGVGGRFSVLSPVGLFGAAMCGIDIEELLAGAAAMKNRIEATDSDTSARWSDNPACVLAAVKYLMFAKKRKPMQIMMPYSNRLYDLADWYRQLWAESLGKKASRRGRDIFTGPTPIKALGATDQHSQIQLYREGPNDKLVVFLEVSKHSRDVRVPDIYGNRDGLSYLGRSSLGKLLNAEKKATEYALAASGRPSVTIRFDEIRPLSVGEFIYLYEFTTSLMGELLDVNAYDQPAVELGKEATFALMGREGFEELAKEIKPVARVDKKYLV